jgi:(S)-ureidoglycine aminohydrolase
VTQPFGLTRDVVKERYALFTPGGFVPSVLPGWSKCVVNIVISPVLGARLVQLMITMEEGGIGQSAMGDTEFVVYVVEGRCSLTVGGKEHQLAAGHFAYVPAGSDYRVVSGQANTRLLIFQKRFEQLAGETTPGLIVGDAAAIEGVPFLGDPKALLQTLLPDTPAFDMAVNIFVYQPGAALPFVETHIMEHGLLMLAGAGIYRLGDDWYPVQAGDVIWMGSYCPQWFAAIGDQPASYIYYKDVNRNPL